MRKGEDETTPRSLSMEYVHTYLHLFSLCVLANNLFVCACVCFHGGEHKYLHVLPLFVGVDGYIYLFIYLFTFGGFLFCV